MLPPEPRLDLARTLVEREQYFIVHAPRQTGKTTSLAALAADLTSQGRHAAVLFSCERAKTAPDVAATERAVLASIAREAGALPARLQPPQPWPEADAGGQVIAGLSAWARRCPLPLVLFFDEIDALSGDSLTSVLSQLREGYNARAHNPFPVSVALCGLRDLRDYKVASGGNPESFSGPSPFNTPVRSLRMGDFTRDQVAALYAQHTADTGQQFTDEAVDEAFTCTQGQPYLVNSLADEIISFMGVRPPATVTSGHVRQARERLILDRRIHLDFLASRLDEPRVRRVIEPMLAGAEEPTDRLFDDDVEYVRDLGLIAQAEPIRPANPIYNEVIARTLTLRFQRKIRDDPRDFLLPDGQLDMGKLMAGFAAFWTRYGASMAQGPNYHEAAAQLVAQAYLQKVLNGGGWVDREYGLGRGRTDLYIRKPYHGADGTPAVQEEVIEIKVHRQDEGTPLPEALEQPDTYLGQLGRDTGYAIIFDRRAKALRQRPDPVFTSATTPGGHEITVLTC